MTDRVPISERALAATFDGGAYPHAWEVVEQYRRATDYARKNDCKSGATASALDLPRSRLRTWIDDGGAPDAVRAIEIARDRGWLDSEFGDPEFAGLNALVANVFSGGSIAAENYAPSFAINHHGEESHLFDALELADVDYRIEADRHRRADEARPSTDGTVLGRVLAALGAPVGSKTSQRLSLPDYLDDAPADVRETFVYSYLENRAAEHDEKATLTIQEQRNQEYLSELGALIEDVAGDRVTIGEQHITISADAARNLGTVR
ncbi:hypothetical protein [Halosolutus gelatinilyticus]|uniref:hypothetical protein n=1 Tax=Halosolutus gelatinilyticus TaxID=2931975 RepID=UPI001FF11CE1|nr:hypothetical protein [Halosolutus gelatinilyticus]